MTVNDWPLLIASLSMLLLLTLFVAWMAYERKDKARLLKKHRELAGEGDECPWSIRLTTTDKQEAMRQARIELGLEQDRWPAPSTAELNPKMRMVNITHPTSLGQIGRCTQEAYDLVYKAKGWIIVPDNSTLDYTFVRGKKPLFLSGRADELIEEVKWTEQLGDS